MPVLFRIPYYFLVFQLKINPINRTVWISLRQHITICWMHYDFHYVVLSKRAKGPIFRPLEVQNKVLMELCELRHLDEVKGNFGIADGIYYTISDR